MKCDFCDNDANVEIVVFVNGKAQKVRMCSSCYQKKLAEMMGQLPKEWGGKELTDQISSMLEKAQEGGFMPGMEVSFLQSDMPNVPPMEDAADAEEKSDEDADDEESGDGTSQLNPFRQLFMPMDGKETIETKEEKTATSARDLAFAKQRKQLRNRRNALVQKMQMALQEEDYEKCAAYRDELNDIGDALLRLNEERKDPYGV